MKTLFRLTVHGFIFSVIACSDVPGHPFGVSIANAQSVDCNTVRGLSAHEREVAIAMIGRDAALRIAANCGISAEQVPAIKRRSRSTVPVINRRSGPWN